MKAITFHGVGAPPRSLAWLQASVRETSSTRPATGATKAQPRPVNMSAAG